MYNRYIPDGTRYARVVVADDAPEESAPPAGEPGKRGGLAGLIKSLHLDRLDTGDILLLLILLFLLLEGDDLELIITLALVVLLGLSK